LLDLAGLQFDSGDVEAGISPGMNGDKLGCVAMLRHPPQCARQRSPGCIGLFHPKALSAKGAKHIKEVPAHAANHGIQNRRRDLCDMRPVFANLILDRI
jgi:hypothetical protein